MAETFCSVQSLRLAEPLLGSATHASAYVFITWPKARWANNALFSPGLPETLSHLLAAWKDERRILTRLISRPDYSHDPETVRVMIFSPAHTHGLEAERVPLERLEACLRAGFEDNDWSAFAPIPDNQHTLFCCTDGKHDNCCAKFGFAAYTALTQKAAKRPANWHIWESSHLGGHRFAATALTFPHAFMLGRMPAGETMASVLGALEAGQPPMDYYRGNGFLDPVSQLADGLAWRLYKDHKPAWRYTLGDIEKRAPDQLRLLLHVADEAGKAETIEMRCIEKVYLGHAKCASIGETPPDETRRWSLDQYKTLPGKPGLSVS